MGKKAELIPWEEIEIRYAKLFLNKKGNVAKPLRLAFGILIIQTEYQFSDVETANMIQEHPYFQYFCGMSGYSENQPFDPSLMVYFRKRLTPEILGKINEMILAKVQKNPIETTVEETDDNEDDHTPPVPPQNGGTLIRARLEETTKTVVALSILAPVDFRVYVYFLSCDGFVVEKRIVRKYRTIAPECNVNDPKTIQTSLRGLLNKGCLPNVGSLLHGGITPPTATTLQNSLVGF